MKHKTTNPNTNKKVSTKPRTVDPDPRIDYAFRAIPISKAMINRLMQELKEWPFSPDNINKTITQFYIKNGLRKQTYYDLLTKYPDLKEIHEQTMLQMGERLWFRSVEKQFDWTPVKHRLWRYSKEFQEDTDYHSEIARKIKESEGNSGNVQYIVVDTNGKKLNE